MISMSVSIPDINDRFVLSLIKKIGLNNKPIIVKVIPENGAEPLDCFPTVQKKISNYGGRMILGWQFWKSQNLIEAEFHAIWESPENELIDITPKPIMGIDYTLFIIDESLLYDEKQKDNFRINITNNSLVDDFIKVCEAIFNFENKGERAYQYELKLSALEQEKYRKLKGLKEIYQTMISNNLNRNTRCLCGSGNKFKHCHGKDLQKTLSHLI
jgi:hypothetical protein